ncbi:MAG: glycosyltransferase family 4 protein [Gemmatimonadota bacterium]
MKPTRGAPDGSAGDRRRVRDRPLRFLMVTTFYPPAHFGGDAIAVQRLARVLTRRGHEVTVLQDVDPFRVLRRRVGGKPRRAATETPSTVQGEDGVRVVRLGSRLPALSALVTQQTGRPLVQARRIRTLLEGGAFDVIHYHNVSLVGGPGILAAGDALKVYEAHEHWLVCPTHVLWRHNREPCTGRQCLRCAVAHRRPPQLWRYTGYLDRQLEHVDLFLAKSEFSRRKHREFGFSREMKVWPYFLPDDVDESDRRALPKPGAVAPGGVGVRAVNARPYFLFVGRLERIKGLHDVLPVFRNLAGADLLVAGTGSYQSVLRREAPPHRVRFLGHMPPESLQRLYREAIALIVPSLCYETFGLILIEAFRNGTPVLARDIGPFREIAEASGGAELFRTREELAEAMRRLMDDPDHRARLAEAGRRAFHAHWSESVVVPEYLRLLHAAAASSGRAELAERIRCTLALPNPGSAAGAPRAREVCS